MIRNVVVGRLSDEAHRDKVEKGIQALRDLRVDGVELHLKGGFDLGLRDGNAHFALTVDLVDEQAYKIYDADREHNRIRREMFAPFCSVIERIQFRLPG